jgi:outer membrane protein OmpA-like peptidoglycan-associated protein
MKKILFALLVPLAGHAEPRVELGVTAGAHAFSHSTELGAADDLMEPGPASSELLGARIGYALLPRLAIEGELTLIPSKDDVLGDRVMVYGLAAHVRFDLLTGKLRPFVVAGLGANILRSSSRQVANDVDQAYHWGLGVRFAVNERVDVRLDGRHELVPDRTHDGATSDFEILLGATYRFGPIARPVPAPLPPPPPPPIVVEEPPPPPPPVIQPEPIAELAGIGFQLDSAVIAIESAPILEKAYQLLATHPELAVEISGHTSADGDGERNLRLSLERAEAVKAYLVGRGIAGARLRTVGHGADAPIGDNRTEEGRRINRRIEFHILQTGGE